MKFFLYFVNILIFLIITINCSLQNCYEYSCDECDSPDYGNCTKCRDTFTLIDGKCPCSFSSCALCSTGLAGLSICEQCKDGYFIFQKDCYCQVNNCEQCAEDGCKKCVTGYYYNETSKECVKNQEKSNCYDPNCEVCFSEEQGACESCNSQSYLKKGECINKTLPDADNKCPEDYYRSGEYCLEKCEGVKCTDKRWKNFFEVVYLCPDNDCLICEDNEIFIFSECDNSKECSLSEGCLNCVDKDECLICQQGYYHIGGICKKCIDGCSICTNGNTCEYCISGYDLTPEKTCNLTYNFDYNTAVYEVYKENLIKKFYPEEIVKYEPIISTPTEIKDSITNTEERISTIITTSTSSPTSTTKIVDTENIKTTNLIPEIKPTEKIQNIDNIDKLIFCDDNCVECFQNKGICQKCNNGYELINNKCKLKCSIDNCLNCELINEIETCNQCNDNYHLKSNKCELTCDIEHCSSCSLKDDTLKCNTCINGYHLDNDKCKINCVDSNCNICSEDGQSCLECKSDKKLFVGKCAYNTETCKHKYLHCNYCIEDVQCYECIDEYELNKNNSCEKKQNYLPLIIILIGILLIIIGIISFCCYSRKKQIQIERMRRQYQNQDQTNNAQIYIRNDLSGSFRSVISKEDLAEEYEMQKRKMKKGKITCMFCQKKPGKFECDCGCIVCKEHSALKEMETEGKAYKVCFNCDKIVKKVSSIKYTCNICMQKKPSVAHFQCGCALEVCKECYIKCKMSSNKCPGCRAII